MRCFLSLIIYTGVIFYLHANHSFAVSKTLTEGKEIICFVNTSNPPLSAIENTRSNSSGFNYNHSTQLQKRFGTYFIAGNLLSIRTVEIPPNNIYSFFVKSTSFFLLNQNTQTLLGEFRC